MKLTLAASAALCTLVGAVVFGYFVSRSSVAQTQSGQTSTEDTARMAEWNARQSEVTDQAQEDNDAVFWQEWTARQRNVIAQAQERVRGGFVVSVTTLQPNCSPQREPLVAHDEGTPVATAPGVTRSLVLHSNAGSTWSILGAAQFQQSLAPQR
jgi:hypothetical protein